MFKRQIKLIIFLTILFIFSNIINVNALSADVAYVVKNSQGVDNILLNEIHNNEFTTDIIFESQISATNFADYRVIVIGDQDLDNPENIPVNKHPSLIINSYNFYEKFLDKQLGWSKGKGSLASPTSLKNSKLYN